MLRRSRVTTIALSTLAVGGLTPLTAAHAASTTIYVDNTNTNCVTEAGGKRPTREIENAWADTAKR